MKQYINFHDGEYIPKKSEDDNSWLFHKFFLESKNCFVYGIYENGALMLIETIDSEKKPYWFARGLAFGLDEIERYPIEYAFKLPTTASKYEKEKLPAGNFPDLGNQSIKISNSANIDVEILAKLFDALILNGDRQIILIDKTDDLSLAQDYIKALSLLLPVDYAKRIGFCLGCQRILKDISVKDAATAEKNTLSVQIWVPQISNFNVKNYEQDYYVFNLDEKTSNYSKKLSSASFGISALGIQNIAKLADEWSDEFKSDEINKQKLDIISMLASFDIYEASNGSSGISDESLLQFAKEQYNNSASLDEETVELLDEKCETALQNVLDKLSSQLDTNATHNLSEGTRGYLFAFLDKIIQLDNAQRNTENEGGGNQNLTPLEVFVPFCANNAQDLNAEERDALDQLIVEDASGRCLELYAESFVNQEEKPYELIRLGEKAIKPLVKGNELVTYAKQGFLNKLCDVISVANFYGIEKDSCQKEIVKRLKNISDSMVQVAMWAILLASSYKDQKSLAHLDIRIKEFTSFMDQKFQSSVQEPSHVTARKKLDYVVDVYNVFCAVLKSYTNNSTGVSDFIYGNGWLENVIASLDTESLLDVEKECSGPGNLSNWSKLHEDVKHKLLEKEVYLTIPLGTTLWDSYNTFLKRVNADEQSSDIKDYIDRKNAELATNKLLADSRFAFATNCYNTLSHSDKIKVKREIDKRLSDVDVDNNETKITIDEANGIEIPTSKRIQVVEVIIDTFGKGAEIKNKHRNGFKPIGILAVVFALISFLILCIPTVVIPLAIGEVSVATILDRFNNYFLPIFAFVPIFIFFEYAFAYMLSKEKNDVMRIKKTNRLTFLCGLLPLLCFVAVYIFGYFFGANIVSLLSKLLY